MTANVMVIIERQFDYPRVVFRAWVAPEENVRMAREPGLARRERVHHLRASSRW